MKPTTTDDRGNRNNVITVLGEKGKAPQKAEKQAKSKPQAEEVAEPVQEEAEPVQEEEEKPQPQKKGGKGQQQQQQQGGGKKGKGQQQQQQQKQQGGGKKDKGPAAEQSKKLVATVKAYDALYYVGDVECGDSVEDVLKTGELFHEALPDNSVMIVSAGEKSFIVAAVVPESKTSSLTAIEWVETALSVVAGAPRPQGTDTLAHGVVQANPEGGIFPLKLKDLCRGPVFQMLRKRNLVKKEESDDEMFFLDE